MESSESPHQPIQKHYRAMMRKLGVSLDEFCNPQCRPTPDARFDKTLRRTGFVLLMFEFGAPPGHRMNYLSNANRADIVEALQELIDNFKADPEWGKEQDDERDTQPFPRGPDVGNSS